MRKKGGLFAGLAIGATLGVLFAPKKGDELRRDLSDKLNDFIYDKYPNEHDVYFELINKYNDNIKNIDKSVNNIDSRCDVIYNDISVNKICDSYEVLYEKLINLYVTDINNYNDWVGSLTS